MVAFSLFGIYIYWYGIFYFISFLAGYIFFLFIKRFDYIGKLFPGVFRLITKSPEDILLYVILGLLIGGRLGHILIYDFVYYIQHPLNIFAVWEGGMSFIGGILGVSLALWLLVRKYSFNYRDFWVFADILIIPTSFGIMLGRIGNFLNQELYGRLVSDVLPYLSSNIVDIFSYFGLFHIYDKIDSYLRINTNFLASFFEGFLLLVISSFLLWRFLKKKKWIPGIMSSLFLIWYSFVRFFLEYFRMDSQSEYMYMFTKSQWFFVVFFVLGVCLFVRSIRYRSSYMK